MDESAHLEYEGEASFGESLALQGNLLAVGVPDRNENSPGNPFDVPGGENTGNPFASNSLVVATPSRRKSEKFMPEFFSQVEVVNGGIRDIKSCPHHTTTNVRLIRRPWAVGGFVSHRNAS